MKVRVFGSMEEITSIFSSDDGTCVVEIMCNGQKHRLSMDQTGKVTVHDHDEQEQMLSRLGDDDPDTTCMRVRKQLLELIAAGTIVC